MVGEMIDIGGRRLRLDRRGQGAPTVVFEHGGGGGSSVQDLPVLRRVAAQTRAIAYDRAGLGRSEPGPPGRSFAERSADLDALLTRIGEQGPLVIVGGSFGALMARSYAHLHPARVAGMVLVDGGDEHGYYATMPRMRAMHEGELRDAAERARNGAMRAELEPQLRRSRLFDPEEKAAALEIAASAVHFEAALDELSVIDTPLPPGGFGALGDKPLVVLSRGRPFTGDMAAWEEGAAEANRRLTALSARGVHVVAARCGHGISIEHPDLVAAAILSVVRAVRGQAFDLTDVRALAADGP